MANDFWILLAMVIYFAAMLSIGFIYSKRSNSSSKEYFAGGRGVGPWLTALSAEASDMSGWLLMGLPGLAYFTGAADPLWTALGLAIGTYLNWKIVARRLRRYSVVAGDAITIPDFFAKRFHDRKGVISTISAIIILVFFCVYVGSCFVTVGKLFSALFGFDYHLMMVLGALVVFVYTIVGGYLSVVMTDFIQGLLMFFALAVVFVGTVASAGGIGETVAFLRAIPGFISGTQVASPTLDPQTGKQIVEAGKAVFGAPTDYGIITIVSMLAWGLGYFGMPQVLVRFLSIRDAEEVRKSRIIATSWCVLSLASAVCIGLVGRAMMPTHLLTGTDAETIFIVLAQTLLPSFVCGVVVSGIFAASMSSSSSYMIIGASAMGENIFRGLFHKKATDRQVMIVARITLVVMFLFGCLVAYDQNSSIFQVVSYAWAGLGASFGPLMLCALYWRRANKVGAVAGMVSGTATVFIWHNLVKPLGGVFAIYELLPAFLVSLLCIVVFSLVTEKPNDQMLYEFDHYMDDPLPGTLPSGSVLVDEPMEAMEAEVRSGKAE
ncbi:sodium/proline symporter [Bifidobacterium platyrrhinorum]|uniref:Sodium/proline symporter n=1 Tax=Bifidobacterium platyrrhinorum TaxID=2661628 RepID=A0A6L9SVJ1_9BIFI|nr:sodium/proline symporter [Bifidobacterium platyrrhinorum]NEG55562.1 sodium/solute symporter [Bifidobacterium platyrrhinorum]